MSPLTPRNILGQISLTRTPSNVSASTSPRIKLEFESCTPADFLGWNIAAVKGEILPCQNYPSESLALKVVDEENGHIAGYAIWGWSPRASEPIFKDKAALPLPSGTNVKLRTSFISQLQKLEKCHKPTGRCFGALPYFFFLFSTNDSQSSWNS